MLSLCLTGLAKALRSSNFAISLGVSEIAFELLERACDFLTSCTRFLEICNSH